MDILSSQMKKESKASQDLVCTRIPGELIKTQVPEIYRHEVQLSIKFALMIHPDDAYAADL